MGSGDNAIAVEPVTASDPRASARREAARGSSAPVAAPAGGWARRARLGALPPGLVLGSLGILGFSFSLPATRLAVADFDPWLVAFGRATVAAALAARLAPWRSWAPA
jgi:hypothetical protein